jgi:hypothetical protein
MVEELLGTSYQLSVVKDLEIGDNHVNIVTFNLEEVSFLLNLAFLSVQLHHYEVLLVYLKLTFEPIVV